MNAGIIPNAVWAEGARRHGGVLLRRAVWERDGGQCTFVGEDGRVCGETRLVEFAHLEPWAKGGEHSLETMALRCRGHNGFEAVK